MIGEPCSSGLSARPRAVALKAVARRGRRSVKTLLSSDVHPEGLLVLTGV